MASKSCGARATARPAEFGKQRRAAGAFAADFGVIEQVAEIVGRKRECLLVKARGFFELIFTERDAAEEIERFGVVGFFGDEAFEGGAGVVVFLFAIECDGVLTNRRGGVGECGKGKKNRDCDEKQWTREAHERLRQSLRAETARRFFARCFNALAGLRKSR